MGCCSISARRAASAGTCQDEMELLEIGGSRKWSISEAQSEGSLHLRDPVTATETATETGGNVRLAEEEDFQGRISELNPQAEVLWGRTREELRNVLFTQPITGWEGRTIHSLGEIVWSSLVLMRSCHMEEMSERYIVLFPFQLLILSVDHMKKAFVYQGLLPLAGMSVRNVPSDTGCMFEMTGPMIESRIISCLSPAEFHIWILSIQQHIKMANAHCPAHPSNIISFLVPCDEQWKKRKLMKHLFYTTILKWEGKPIQHLGRIHYLAMVQVAYASMGDFKERLLVLFPEDLVFLSVDRERTAIAYEGKLPLAGIQAKEKSAVLGRLEFEITGSLTEPILVACSTAEDYEKCLFYLQKPEQILDTVTVQPPPMVPKKSLQR
ncbi:pleckstrin homology domain-containing family N member 1-like isoform X3 [Mauremys reevesii]|uniref:pleckstrin homology domain-containing family N member 1-like isoform X3 n=1 Tax=Mauremys reevesii TaxID=260615 RepID=UPI00193F5629|nr:pleckstrin homology domain-containing family N member 1-like isoform X3 [Mauremys reevesii]